jgi:dTDP-4-amino-4,6-dideoxygalactose transaminase
MAWGVKAGDAVFVPAFTFVATAEVVVWGGAIPVFVDVLDDTFNMDTSSLETAIEQAKAQGLTPRVVIPVDLFGQPADYRRLLPIAKTQFFLMNSARAKESQIDIQLGSETWS